MRALFLIALLLVAGVWPAILHAQLEANEWYFGPRLGISFRNGGMPLPIGVSQMNTQEGSATISHTRTGDLLFYTNGFVIWDASHNIMPGAVLQNYNGPEDRFPGYSSTQAALIVPHPGEPNQYFVFNPGNRTGGTYPGVIGARRLDGFSYTLVDMSLNNGMGDVLRRGNLNSQIKLTERLTGTKRCGEDFYWIVVSEFRGDRFIAYRVDQDGLSGSAVTSRVGVAIFDEFGGVGQMKMSPDGSMLATVHGSPLFGWQIELYLFDVATGKLSDQLVIPAPRDDKPYGLSFSPDNSRLYISSIEGNIYQYNVSDYDEDKVKFSRQLVSDPDEAARYGSMQLGPDGRLYIAHDGVRQLSVIQFPNEPGLACRFRSNAIQTGGPDPTSRNTLGLPNFMDHLFLEGGGQGDCSRPLSAFAFESVCSGDCVSFRDESTSNPEAWEWEFEGGIPARADGAEPPEICYPRPGDFKVRLITRNRFGADTSEQQISIFAPPALDAGPDIHICAGASLTLQAQGQGRMRWTPAEGLSDADSPTPVIRPSATREYTVTLVDERGCVSSASLTVFVESVSLEVDEPPAICVGESARLRAEGGVRYVWTPAEGLDDPFAAEPLAAPKETTTYTVQTFNEFDCSTSATISLIVLPKPELDLGEDISLCFGQSVTLGAPAGLRYEWRPATGLSDPTRADPVAGPQQTTLYTLTVTNEAGCSASDEIEIRVGEELQVAVEQEVAFLCAGGSVRLGAAGGDSYEWSPAEGLDDPFSATPLANPTRATTYTVRARRDGCEGQAQVQVEILPSPEIDAGPDQFICRGMSATLQASGALRYEWEPAAGLSDAATASPLASPSTTTLYRLRAWDANGCEGRDSVWLHVSPEGSARIVIPDLEIQPGESLTMPIRIATPADLLPLSHAGLQIELEYNARMLLLEGGSRGVFSPLRSVGNQRSVRIDLPAGNLTSGEETVTELRLQALLSSEEHSELSVRAAGFEGSACVQLLPAERAAQVSLHEFCVTYDIGVRRLLSIRADPNPAQGDIDISIETSSGSTQHHIALFNNFGRLLRQQTVDTQSLTKFSLRLHRGGLTNGLYLLRVTAGSEVRTQTILLTD